MLGSFRPFGLRYELHLPVNINPIRIRGSWDDGYTLDVHTVSSTPIGYSEYGHLQFDTNRSEIGESLYQLKYQGQRGEVASLAMVAADFVQKWGPDLDVVVPVPATRARPFQPVRAIAERLAKGLELPFDSESVKRAKKAAELKSVSDPDKRAELLEGAFRVEGSELKNKRILLFDDLFRSGATLNEITALILDAGGAMAVYALALTRTRTAR